MNDLDVIVSLTTWKGRINDKSVRQVLYRLVAQQQTHYRYKVVLVLSKEEFGDNFIVPEDLDLFTSTGRFEILWTQDNTRALKKLTPTMEKYPDLPIITLDDDELVTEDCIERVMREHEQNPNVILGGSVRTIFGITIVCMIRLFPPHSLAYIPTHYFKEYFNYMQDDEWNGICARLKGTKMQQLRSNVVINYNFGSQAMAFNYVYRNFDYQTALNNFYKDHPEYK